MEKELKDMIEKSRKGIKDIEEKIEDVGEEFSEDIAEFWGDTKKYIDKMSGNLKDASEKLDQDSDEAKLQAHLGMMEAQDKLGGFKEGFEEFVQKAASEAKTEMDTAVVRAHLAKKEAEDFWEVKGKSIAEDFNSSKVKVEKAANEAIVDVKNYFDKLVNIFSDKA